MVEVIKAAHCYDYRRACNIRDLFVSPLLRTRDLISQPNFIPSDVSLLRESVTKLLYHLKKTPPQRTHVYESNLMKSMQNKVAYFIQWLVNAGPFVKEKNPEETVIK